MSNSVEPDPSIDEAPILHVDMDAFFASVEILDDPSLRGKPVCVGGAGARGVIASASYEARRYGVRSAMPSVVALRKCPQLIILPGRFDRYEEYSSRFHDIVRDITPLFEPISLDEVFCDLRGLSTLGVRPLGAARHLRQRLRDELHLECGIGVGRNKLFAKLGSKEAKPSVVDGRLRPGAGVFWVSPEVEAQWLETLPVRALWGVGPATAEKLHRLGFRLVRDLAKVDAEILRHHLGPAMATVLSAYARGEDDRPVVVERALKSIGHDQTFGTSVVGASGLAPHVVHHAGIVARALRQRGQVAKTVTVGVRFDDLSMVQRSQTLPFGVDDEGALASVAQALIEGIHMGSSVRLLALHVSSLLDRSDNQVQLAFDVESGASGTKQAIESSRQQQVSNEALRDVLDDIRHRYGTSAVGVASDLEAEGLHVQRQRGSHAFGPTEPEER